MLESQKSGYIYFNCFELPSDWLLSYWMSQSKGTSKQLLCRVGLWRFHVFYFCKKGKYTNLSLNTRLSGDVGCAMIGIVDSFPFPDSLISIELQYIIAPVSDKDRLLTFIWEVFSFPMALVCFWMLFKSAISKEVHVVSSCPPQNMISLHTAGLSVWVDPNF